MMVMGRSGIQVSPFYFLLSLYLTKLVSFFTPLETDHKRGNSKKYFCRVFWENCALPKVRYHKRMKRKPKIWIHPVSLRHSLEFLLRQRWPTDVHGTCVHLIPTQSETNKFRKINFRAMQFFPNKFTWLARVWVWPPVSWPPSEPRGSRQHPVGRGSPTVRTLGKII